VSLSTSPAPETSAEAPTGAARRRRRIGEVLVSQGLLDEAQLQQALDAQRDTPAGTARPRLGQVVIALGLATERQVAEALAEALTLPLVDLGRTMVVPDAVRLLPRAVAERSGVLVIERSGSKVTVATADPTNVVALDDVKLYTGAASSSSWSPPTARCATTWPAPGRCRRTPPTSHAVRGHGRRPGEVEDVSAHASRPRRSSGSSTSCSPTPCAPAPATCTSSRRPASCASATASTACCATS
jgi:hypothetical protein